jgi:hypothetical protein
MDTDEEFDEDDQFLNSLLSNMQKLCFKNEANIDYFNARFYLCKAMEEFTPICEARTKFLVPLFFRFLK